MRKPLPLPVRVALALLASSAVLWGGWKVVGLIPDEYAKAGEPASDREVTDAAIFHVRRALAVPDEAVFPKEQAAYQVTPAGGTGPYEVAGHVDMRGVKYGSTKRAPWVVRLTHAGYRLWTLEYLELNGNVKWSPELRAKVAEGKAAASGGAAGR